uniref:Uncharacterized protein n=1 Tax=viral metagenome TaxID=1070528 RepID=A0A6C0J9S0_9ZZZZ
MDIRIEKACSGATKANGGMNLPELKVYLSSVKPDINVKSMKRSVLIKDICNHISAKSSKPALPGLPGKPIKPKLPTTIKVTKVRKDGHVTVTIPTHIQNMFSVLPDLDREYGGLMDYKLGGEFESISLIAGAQNTIEAKEIPDYETMWHNHPTEPLEETSVPSTPDLANLIMRSVQVRLIFVKKRYICSKYCR